MYRLYLLIILTLVNVNILKAGGESVVNSSKIKDFVVNNNNTWQVDPAHTLTVKDPQWNDILTNKFTDESVVTRVWLKIDHSIIDYTQLGFNTTANLKIVYKTLSGGTFVQSTQYKDLVLEYNPAVNNETQKDIQVVEIPGAYYAEVSLTGLSLTIGGVNQPLDLYPVNVKLEVEESVNRNYSEAFFFTPSTNFSVSNLNATAVNNANTGGTIQLHWDYTPSAEEYEVEWAHINDYGTANNTYLSTSELTYNFRNNATRVRISDNFYTIPLTFDHGYLVYRVRPVGKEANSVYDLFGKWSIISESGTVAGLTAGQNYYQVTTPFQNTLNWQYIATYAEEGKNKLLMNYMDGTLRSRQKVTLSNTENNAIVAETIYDFYGRPAIEVLPTPSGTSSVAYYSAYNKNNSGVKYSWEDFDKSPTSCTYATASMSDGSGSARYYSQQNPDKNQQQSLLPEANGFPFVQTEYEPDNTGKPRRKGGAGTEFQLNSGKHNTMYLYGQPFQIELDRLFGSEAGNAEHYQKNLVIDPNGQASVSYIDMYGKTVATALAGEAPAQLAPFPGINANPFTINENILENANHVSSDGNSLVCEKDFSISTSNTSLTINYTFTGEQYSETCMNGYCFDCLYNLDIVLINKECGQVIYSQNINLPLDMEIDNGCSAKNSETPVNQTITGLAKGSYTIRKKLTIRNDAAQQYADTYAAISDCVPDVEDEAPDTTGCCWDCNDCKTLTSSLTNYTNSIQDKITAESLSEEEVIELYKEEVKRCSMLCEETTPCESINVMLLNDVSLNGQYGEYYDETSKSIKPELFPLSVFNTSNKLMGVYPHPANWKNPQKESTSPGVFVSADYVDEYGNPYLVNYELEGFEIDDNADIITQNGVNYVKPQYLKHIEDFIHIWKPSFAKALVVYHPEYGYYNWCLMHDEKLKTIGTKDISSNDFDRIISEAESTADGFANFQTNGILPTITSSTDLSALLNATLDADPYFTNNTLNATPGYGANSSSLLCLAELYYYLEAVPSGFSSGRNLMYTLLQQYKRVVIGGTLKTYNVAHMAYINSIPSSYYGTSFPTGTDPETKTISQLITQNTYKDYLSYYLQCKKFVMEIMADCYSKGHYHKVNSVLPPYSRKQKGIFIPFDDYGDKSKHALFGFLYDFNHSRTYNTLNIENAFPSIIPLNDNTQLKEFADRASSFYSSFMPQSPSCTITYNPDLSAFRAGKKEKRVPKLNDSQSYAEQDVNTDDDADDAETQQKIKEKTDYYRYVQTGQCPLAFNLEALLNGLVNDETGAVPVEYKLFSASNVDIGQSYMGKDLYDKLNGSQTSQSQFLWKSTFTGSPVFTGYIYEGTTLKMNIEFTDATGQLEWKYAKEFKNINFTGFASNQTNIWAKVRTVDLNGISKDFVVTGRVYNCVSNNNFTCPDLASKISCKANCETRSLMKLVAEVISYTKAVSPAYVDDTYFGIPSGYVTNTDESECFRKLFYKDEDPTLTKLEAKVNYTTNTLVIRREDQKAQVTISNFTFGTTNIGPGYFSGVSSIENNPSGFSANYKYIYGGNELVTTFTGTINYQVVINTTTYQPAYTVGECTPFKSLDCMTKYHTNKEELPKFLSRVGASGLITNGTDIFLRPGNFLNQYMQEAWGGYNDLKMRVTNTTQDPNLAVILIYRPVAQLPDQEICTITIDKGSSTVAFADMESFEYTGLPLAVTNNISGVFYANGQTTATTVPVTITSGLLVSDCIAKDPCIPGQDLPLSAFLPTEFQRFDGNVPYTSNFTPLGFDPITNDPVITSVNSSYFSNCSYALPTEVVFGTPPYAYSIKDQHNPNTGRFLTARTSCTNTTIYKQLVKIKAGYQYKAQCDFTYKGDPIQFTFKINGTSIATEYFNTPGYSSSWKTQKFDFIYKALQTEEVYFEIVNTGVTRDEILLLDNISLLEAKDCTPNTNITQSREETDSCNFTLLNIQANNTYVLTQQAQANAKQEFIGRYKTKCLEALESLVTGLSTKEYHYTLYYYDQAGNLTKTIPPQGVTLLTDPTQLNNVKTERQNGTVNTRPAHTMATWYEYNTLNQVVFQTSPDGGTTGYWYDWLGRIIVSQNAKQNPDAKYSYTLYDNLGRISETGELTNNAFPLANDERFVKQTDFDTWVAASVKANIVKTCYDIAAVTVPNFTPENLLNRVSAVAVYPTAGDLASGIYSHATHYSYDIHGNVQTLIQDFPDLEAYHNRYKRIDYQYDLISGKVNRVNYQAGKQDQFFHRYEYDADNRLTHAYTSRDGVIWEKEAKYFYYQHGPLARTETGDLQVQGLDYAYTLQGWIKGINSTLLEGDNDIGRDNNTAAANLHKYFAQDAASYSLKYFNNDFSPINTNYSSFIATNTNSSALYNGNIGVMATTIRHQNDYLAKPQQTVYNYDQLNRIYEMYVQNSINGNTWANSYSSDIYNESYFYDANGNITNLSRKDKDGNYLDNMTYNYQAGTNKLNYIADPYHPTSVDIEGQSANNYTYDAIGNLTKDVKGGLDEISWTSYGKIAEIKKDAANNNYRLVYDYDAMGNRVRKSYYNTSVKNEYDGTWYVRDASGNIMATYTLHSYNGITPEVKLQSYELYGSDRLGSLNLGMAVEGDYNLTATTNFTRSLGLKQYEISNHLGNVLTTFSDQRVLAPAGMSSTNSNALTPKLISAQDYYPFGMLMTGRSWNEDKTKYSFNGQEKDREIYNNESITTALFWEYDGRIGRRWNLDPKPQVFISDYAAMSNNPILMLDFLGDYAGDYLSKTGEYLGTDNIDDKKVYVAEKSVVQSNTKDGVVNAEAVKKDKGTKELSINRDQLFNRAKWIWGEGGVNVVESVENEKYRVSDCYAWTIKNLRKKVKTEDDLYDHMIIRDKKTKKYVSLYQQFKNGGYNRHQKVFHNAIQGGFSSLYINLPDAQFVVESIVKADLNISSDPTGGAYGWLGGLAPNTRNAVGESYKSALIIKTSDNYYHYFHRYF